jgi:GGDEF domain-containing protein
MAEDLIHKIKERHERELGTRADEDKRNKEISLLKKSPFGLVNWFRITRFALEYGTVTLFTHRIRASAFNLIKIRAASWFREVEPELLKILDDYYVYLSTLEYNAIMKLTELSGPLDRIAAIPPGGSYGALEIKGPLGEFAKVYIAVIRNRHFIEKGLAKVYKEKKAPHGFWGDIGYIIDKPLFNNKPVRYSRNEQMSKSIAGVLFSCYTIIHKVQVTTLNQLVYLTGDEGILNDRVKHLSEKALEKIEFEEKQYKKEESQSKTRLGEIINLTERFAVMGPEIAERIFQYGARAQLKLWRKEAEIRPFYKMMKVIDGFSRFFLDVLSDSRNLIITYDDKEYEGYMERFSGLFKSIETFNQYIRDLEGGKGKDLYNVRVMDNSDSEELMRDLADTEGKLPDVEGARSVRETLGEISAGCYNLCLRFNDVINDYNMTGKIEKENPLAGYDFFRNARVSHSRSAGIEVVLGKKEVTLADLLEGGCSVALYISSLLNHYGIEAIKDEAVMLKQEMDSQEGVPDSSDEGGGDSEAEFHQDLDKLYTDTLTGFKRKEYFQDFIIPAYYDSNMLYKEERERHVFCAEPLNLVNINRKYGREEGDRVYSKFTSIVNRHLSAAENDDNAAIRNDDGMITGYINDISYMEAVDILVSIVDDLRSVTAGNGDSDRSEFLVNFGIYPERKGTNVHFNISVAKKLMMQRGEVKAGHVTFLRNQNRIIKENDFDRMDHLNDELVSFLE